MKMFNVDPEHESKIEQAICWIVAITIILLVVKTMPAFGGI